jgi:ADP-ribose pyrophosphatase YjhB (NUDIX family)
LLVVKHYSESPYYVLPGGHLEWAENIEECMSRELKEELGVKGKVGRLLYVNTFIDENSDKNMQSVEFFFAIDNSAEYFDTARHVGSHASELAEIRWVSKDDDVQILPPTVGKALKDGTLGSESVGFIALQNYSM